MLVTADWTLNQKTVNRKYPHEAQKQKKGGEQRKAHERHRGCRERYNIQLSRIPEGVSERVGEKQYFKYIPNLTKDIKLQIQKGLWNSRCLNTKKITQKNYLKLMKTRHHFTKKNNNKKWSQKTMGCI